MLRVLLPQLDAVVVESVEAEADMVATARTRAGPVGRPGCRQWSSWEHSRYVRHPGDEAVGGRAVRIDLSVRRRPGPGIAIAAAYQRMSRVSRAVCCSGVSLARRDRMFMIQKPSFTVVPSPRVLGVVALHP